MTRTQVAAALAAHYTAKLNGTVDAWFDNSKRAYCIHGRRLPATSPSYPNPEWEMLDYIKPARARNIVAA